MRSEGEEEFFSIIHMQAEWKILACCCLRALEASGEAAVAALGWASQKKKRLVRNKQHNIVFRSTVLLNK